MQQPAPRWSFVRTLPLGIVVLVAAFHVDAVSQLAAPVSASATPVFDAARARLRDAETLRSLSFEGQLLYQRERVKLDGYQYCSQAVAQAERGEFRDSIRSASKALHVGRMQGNDDLVALSKRDLAIAYSYAGDLDAAERYAREAIGHRARDTSIVAGPAYKTLGDVAARRGDLALAVDLYAQAQQASSERFRPLVQISLANAYVAQGDAVHARELYDRLPPPEGTLAPLYRRGLGNLLLLERRPADALASFEAAAREAVGIDAAYHRLWAVEGAARALLTLGDKAAARARYVEAAQLSNAVRARFRSEEFKTGLFGDMQQIFERAIGLLSEAGNDAEAWVLSERSRARALLDVLRERVEPVGDDTLRQGVEAARLSDVTAALRPHETLVQFHSLDDRLLVWILDARGLRGASLPLPRAELDHSVEAFRAAIFDRRRNAAELGAALHQRLLAPLGLPAGGQLVIVPHGAMHYLPFQALRSADGVFLIERYAIAVEPSASVAVELRRRDRVTDARLVAFGNPSNTAREDLPGAEREVQLIGGLFPERQVYFHRDASKSRFRDVAGSAHILHVAAHAEVDGIDPLQSRILLAAEEGDPGFLNAREVYGLDLRNVSLVTLSACESGLGRVARGDEILGFTRSFLSAGARALLVSLWPVADDSTELLMSTFYERLARGAEAIDAMRAAQLAVRSNQKFAHPFFWAPFNLVGDWRLTVKPATGAGS